MNMNQMKNAASNLHAANATSVSAVPMNVSAAQLGQMNLNHVRSAAFKPAMPVAGANVVLPTAGTGVPNTAGAGALQLSGRWSLDREDSDSTNDYLEAMGLPLIARQAADKLDLMVIISQNPGDFIITRRTRIFTETKQLKFGQEVNVKNNLITVTGDAAQIKTVTQLSGFRGVLTDIRTLDPRGRMHVELTLTLPEKPSVIINRYFKKTSDSTSLENLPAFDMSLETAGDVKRKR
ncbi:hypothetical protein BBO99_00004839 [Phytophthora kernoviae]|uniref:Uncharacterized protein n=2 Tax=Phytophthora kernoviae TaxID=325452 RepID=A0A3R7HIP0_9STRA|nr:hypothetical protein G195_005299 [Phytophthora kernoviae 00238/432]KAG2519933.1 hypothetical protein JM16_004653 [Phytophthora kernoviae]KAG2526786.1 hypothetical protein JM18_004202 [Phytophthora kernoviae]RLN06252.1 hypothetical protein BBI17_004823 [Phytophthora kernoviae]RLN79997.1 hypothetical protein BBO99_00004839 [Phytophthora kernoviae]